MKGGAEPKVPFVVDASVAAAWLLPDEVSDQTDAILSRIATDGARAPSLLWYEIRNILVMAARRGRLPAGEAAPALARLRRLPIETVDLTLSDDAGVLRMAEKHGLTAYDATYLALAQATRSPLATTDRALARAAERAGLALVLDAG